MRPETGTNVATETGKWELLMYALGCEAFDLEPTWLLCFAQDCLSYWPLRHAPAAAAVWGAARNKPASRALRPVSASRASRRAVYEDRPHASLNSKAATARTRVKPMRIAAECLASARTGSKRFALHSNRPVTCTVFSAAPLPMSCRRPMAASIQVPSVSSGRIQRSHAVPQAAGARTASFVVRSASTPRGRYPWACPITLSRRDNPFPETSCLYARLPRATSRPLLHS